jgi:thioredoxin reductase (NADPH)
MHAERLDCLVVGGGPAGLTAALYLARFRRRAVVVDAGESRLQLIDCTRNQPGFPGGIAGHDLLARMHRQADDHGVRRLAGRAALLQRDGDGFIARLENDECLASRCVILATGVSNIELDLPERGQAIARGLLRYCPICDGFEALDRNIGVVGRGSTGLGEAIFLRTYSAQVTLMSFGRSLDLTPPERERAARAQLTVVDEPLLAVRPTNNRIEAETVDRTVLVFDTLYSALGSLARSELARQVGAVLDECGCIEVDRHQRTSIAGLYVAGDVVSGLDQIGVAMGQGAVAATALHNDLRAEPSYSPMPRAGSL